MIQEGGIAYVYIDIDIDIDIREKEGLRVQKKPLDRHNEE